MSSLPPSTIDSSLFDGQLDAVRRRMTDRFGLVPSFFMMAREPAIVEALYGLAEFAYFDSPLPALFKERLFTYVSRLCAVPYCMARHCGFLVGRGNVSGQPDVSGVSVASVVDMLRRPFPDENARATLLNELRAMPSLRGWPASGSPDEDRIFFAAAATFVKPLETRALLRELRRILGSLRHEYLLVFLGFIRFAHFWTETHPDLRFEEDLEQLLEEQRALAAWITGYQAVVEAELQRQVEVELYELESLRARTATLEADAVALRDEVELRGEASNLAKVGFMATVSHELRTPLNAIIGYADLLQAGVAGSLSARAAGYVDRIRITARHQQQIIEEILTFSRLDAGGETVTLAPIRLDELREEITALVAPLAEQKELVFTTRFDDEPQVLWTDPRKLRQILLNLLGNAVKFTASGSVTLAVGRRGDHVAFSVIDTGPGISPGEQESIFDAFTQLDASTTREHGGTGLGLAITRRLVQLLDGRVLLESSPGQGATFTVELPLDPTP